MAPQSPSEEAPWDLTQFSQLPSAVPTYFPVSHWWSEISSISKAILFLGRARSCRTPNVGYRGAESAGWCDVFSKKTTWDMMHQKECCPDEAANHQLPIAVAFWIIQMVSAEECSSLTRNLMQIHCPTCSVILNATATQYTRSLSGIYQPLN